MERTVVTLATIPAILGLVNLTKRLGIPGAWNALIAVVLGIVFGVGDYLAIGPSVTSADLYSAAATGLILGLSAAGLYDATSASATKILDVTPSTIADLEDDDGETPVG